MPKYRVISELDPGDECREPRGTRLRLDEARIVTVVQAASLADATADAANAESHSERRIVSVEELGPVLAISDEALSRALGNADSSPTGEPLVDPEIFDDSHLPLQRRSEFVTAVQQVVYGLRESGLVPGLEISVLANEPDEPYAMIEVHDDARGIFLSRGTEIRKLTDDHSATGWNGVLAVARALIALSNDLQ
ncbi:hypothetical protein ACFCV3_32385 [Kribbella sp. NPDC056345]|uniref:hypothetical protein n=1 Tax=Kribbella sp. NPDC056345 TaxID=3345789 RepID=UPI0035D5D8A4